MSLIIHYQLKNESGGLYEYDLRHLYYGVVWSTVYNIRKGLWSSYIAIWHDNRGGLFAHHTLLPNMYRDNRDRPSPQITI